MSKKMFNKNEEILEIELGAELYLEGLKKSPRVLRTNEMIKSD